jgi:hypothetical protein
MTQRLLRRPAEEEVELQYSTNGRTIFLRIDGGEVEIPLLKPGVRFRVWDEHRRLEFERCGSVRTHES